METSFKNPSIFISYRREDTSGYAGRLYDKLKNHLGDQVFMDIDTIDPGSDFIMTVENAVSSCNILIALIGRNWLNITDMIGRRRLDNPEDFVRLEILSALNQNIKVIPVLVQGASMPHREDLPEPIGRLARLNAIELSDTRWAYDMERLIKVIEQESINEWGRAQGCNKVA